MGKLTITVDGCDDSTSVEIEATDAQEVFLRELADKITAASTYVCKPTMSVEVIEP